MAASGGVKTNVATECKCGFDDDLFMCIDGDVYRPCENPNCGGVCELDGKCDCSCHRTEREVNDA